MSTAIKLATVLLVLNIVIYIGVSFARSAEGDITLNEDLKFHWKGDLIDTWLEKDTLDTLTQNTRENWTDYGVTLNNETGTPAQQLAGSFLEEGGLSFLDPLKIAWKIVPTLYNISIAPIALFFNFRFPVFVGLMIGIPYMIIFILTIFSFIRGVGD